MDAKQEQADQTRTRILEVASEEMHRVGFQAASISDILKRTGLSKGALYHHFPTKKDLGYAVLDELYAELNWSIWGPIVEADHPVEALRAYLGTASDRWTEDQARFGCPLNNLAQEMSPLDEGFRTRVRRVIRRWRDGLEQAFRRARRQGELDPGSDPEELAALVVACVQGAISLSKNAQDRTVFETSVRGLLRTLECSDRPPRPAPS